MAQAATAPLDRAKELAGGAATVAIVAAVLIVIGAVAGEIDPIIGVFRNREATPDMQGVANVVTAVGVFWLMALPSFLLAGALIDLSKVLDEYGKGQFFTLKASAHVRKAGEGAIWALVFKIVASPTIVSWITHEGRGFIWHMEPFDLGLVAFAAFVMVLGRVLEAAAKIKQENDEIV
ncbi:MAG: DUF2975 domain-containing protein [Phycisphaerales bacterium]|nr:DUF2975 domain-containing protein [Hyphomonadaceae bacterium]